MSNRTPVFPMPASQHFSDYGFDPQIDYFQVLEEGRNHKRETSARSSIDALHFKLQKPISKDDPTRSVLHMKKKKKKQWRWKNALLFLKWRRWPSTASSSVGRRRHHHAAAVSMAREMELDLGDVHRARAFRASGSLSGPVYAAEIWSGSSTPYRSTERRPSSGPLAGILTPARIPYQSLRELNMGEQHRISTSSAKPIYLVT
ncbi:PREDICTED: uncharacterized protein LOC104818909 [Tarenaya hassleriana]|uniref:uncharacterized protein LOC104818909 n=1 Tax=Tarenaya hassleriana TaxID=28532 RepID=UPI00053C742D|nr:PREDICTED: uncharacterized protein LOC104818909 [Tarenaya hassleriana]